MIFIYNLKKENFVKKNIFTKLFSSFLINIIQFCFFSSICGIYIELAALTLILLYYVHLNSQTQKTVINRDEDTYLYVKGRFTPIISEEVWDKYKAIRESKMELRKTREGKLEKTGVRTSEDIWAKRLVCRCGYRMRKDKWHVNKTGLTYGYKCYN